MVMRLLWSMSLSTSYHMLCILGKVSKASTPDPRAPFLLALVVETI